MAHISMKVFAIWREICFRQQDVRFSARTIGCGGQNIFTMVGQSKISNFFQRTKREYCNSSENVNDVSNPSKKMKLDADIDTVKRNVLNTKDNKTSDSVNNETLIPTELNYRIEDKRLEALIKLQSKKTPALSSNIGSSWFKALQKEFSKEYFDKLSKFVEKERKNYTVYPPVDQVYTWTTMCPIRNIKVVILGQDPYHGPKQAHGLCFSVQKGVALPPSLQNIYEEVKNDVDGFTIPCHGNLSGWAKQGVLLLNACLTVRAHQPNSHKDQGWEMFTDAVIKWINDNSRGVVFLLWGAYAQKKGAFIDKKKHHVLQCAHPSPFSVRKGFFGCGHFSKTNSFLKEQNKTPIDWNKLSDEEDSPDATTIKNSVVENGISK